MPKFFTKYSEDKTSPQLAGPALDPAHEIPVLAEHGRTDPGYRQSGLDGEKDPVRILLEWTAPSRPFRRKDRSYYTTIAIIIILLILISLLMREFILIGALMAVAFVVYVLGFIAPEDVKYRISTQGVTIGEHFYFWTHLDSFWFEQKEGMEVLHILTVYHFPGQLMLVLGDQDQEQLKKIVARYLYFHEIAPKTMIDNWAKSLQRLFPLEKSSQA